ncbi:MAG: hypothetical protein WBJ13_01950 [Sedimentibacter sp.]
MEKTILNIKQMCQVNLYSYKLAIIPFGSLKTQIYKVSVLKLRRTLLKNKEEAMQLSGLQSLLEKLRLMPIDDIWGLNEYAA